ncbi:MAG: DUF6524 family protein [Gemmobacter sp.]|nr:DUF6524 family protein [Gemmobacter sp.]
MPFLLRWIGAFALLSLTWNPTEWNFVTWSMKNYSTQLPLTVLLGLVALVAYVVYLRATLRSIGPLGVLLVVALFGALIWVLVDWGVLETKNSAMNQWMGIVMLSLVLGIGLSWSFARRRLSGQADVDDVDE